MRIFFFSLSKILLIILLLFPKITSAKQSLVVKDLTPKKGVDKQTTSALFDVIRDTISKLDEYNVQSLHDLAAVSKIVEEKLKLGCDDTKCLIELAGAMGTDLVLAGSLSKFGTVYTFSLRLISSRGPPMLG